jgi:hypothetical protein
MAPDQTLDHLAAEFFRVFARVEYALKAAGFNHGEGPAVANWTAFAKAIEPFVETPPSEDVRQAIAFILAEPPKKQFVSNGLVEWRDVAPATTSRADALFQYIRRIRNNLFHGGKFNGHWFAPERSERLMMAGLVVLREAVACDPRVREAYHG